MDLARFQTETLDALARSAVRAWPIEAKAARDDYAVLNGPRLWPRPQGGQFGEPTKWDEAQALASYTGHVYACAALVGDAVARLVVEAEMVQVADDGDEVDLGRHFALDVVRRPNPWTSGAEFFKLWSLDLDLTGNHYALKLRDGFGDVRGLWRLMPDRTRAVLTEAEYLVGWNYYPDGLGRGAIFLPAEDVIHSKLANPQGGPYGWGTLRAAAYERNTLEYIRAYEQSALKNQMRPDYVVIAPVRGQEDLDRLYTRIAMHHQGYDRYGEPLLLPEGSKTETIDFKTADSRFIELSRMKRDDIYAIFRTPKTLHGHLEDSPSRGTLEAAEVYFGKYAVDPRLDVIGGALNACFVNDPADVPRPEGVEYALRFPSAVPEDRAFFLEESKALAALEAFRPDELRERHGYDPAPGGDVILVSSAKQPLTIAADPPEPPPAPPVPAPPPAAAPAKAHAPALAKAIDVSTEQKRAAFWKAALPRMEAPERGYQRALAAFFRKQRARVLDGSGKRWERLVAKFAGTSRRKVAMAVREWIRKDEVSEIFEWDVALENRELAEVLETWNRRAHRNGWDAGAEQVLVGLGSPPNERAIARLRQHAVQIAGDVNEETRRLLASTLADGVEAGESTAQLAARVRASYGEMESYRAHRIARTETTFAFNQGTHDNWTAGPAAEVVTGKTWITARDEHVRDSHEALDGATVGLESTFANGLLFPGDMSSGDPGELVNCRCTVAATIRGAE